MKTFSQLIESLNEAWPGTPEWNAKFGKKPSTDRHDVIRGDGVTRAIRKYNPQSGESEEPEAHKAAGEQPVKRGRGRPPGKYGSYKGHNRTGKYVGVHAARKQKAQEAFDYLMTLESEEEIQEFMSLLEEDIFADLHEYLVELNESEEPEILDEMQQGKEYSYDHIMKKIKSGEWEAQSDVKPGRYVELRHHSGKRVQVQVKEENEQVDENKKVKPYTSQRRTPPKGSLAWEIMMDRKKKEKEPPIEPKDQMVGNAKIIKEEAEPLDEAVQNFAAFISRK